LLKTIFRTLALSFVLLISVGASVANAPEDLALVSRVMSQAAIDENDGKVIEIKDVKSIPQAKMWIKQHCPRVKTTTTPGLKSFYVPSQETIIFGEDVSNLGISFVLTHEMAHHYQWVSLESGSTQWNDDLKTVDGKASKGEIQADHITYEIIGFNPHPMAYAKTEATPAQKSEAQRILKFGRTNGC
jgi:hypothetical protein